MTMFRAITYMLFAALLLTGFFLLMSSPWGRVLRQHGVGPTLSNPVAEGMNTVELAYVGYDGWIPPVFTVQTAMMAGFTDVQVGADRYRKAGNIDRAWFRTAASGPRPRYRITDYLLKRPDTGSWPDRGDTKIVITDTLTNQEIDRWRGPASGWANEHARTVVAAALKPRKAIRRVDPDHARGTLSVRPATRTLSASELNEVLHDCPDTYVVTNEGQPHGFEVRTPGWIFGTDSYPYSVVCSADGVFVFVDRVLWYDIHGYWLGHDGTLKGEVYSTVRGLKQESWLVARVFSAEVRNGKLHARLAYFPVNNGSVTVTAHTELDIVAPIWLAE